MVPDLWVTHSKYIFALTTDFRLSHFLPVPDFLIFPGGAQLAPFLHSALEGPRERQRVTSQDPTRCYNKRRGIAGQLQKCACLSPLHSSRRLLAVLRELPLLQMLTIITILSLLLLGFFSFAQHPNSSGWAPPPNKKSAEAL